MRLSKDSTPVQRSKSLRSQPYDLRRRVLVNNFMKDQRPSEIIANRPPTPRIPYQLQSSRFECSRRSFEADEEPSEQKQETKDVPKPDDAYHEQIISGGIIDRESKPACSPSQDLLYLLSRRLRASETSRLRQPCRKSQRSAVSRTSKMRLAESQEKLITNRSDSASCSPRHRSIFKSSTKRTPIPVPKLRTRAVQSYPTFDKLNEICSCDSNTYKKTIIALRGGSFKVTSDFTQSSNTPAKVKRSSSTFKNPLSDVRRNDVTPTADDFTHSSAAPNKVKRTSSLSRSLSRILRRKPSEVNVVTPPVAEQNQKESVKKLEKRRSFVSKLLSPFSSRRRSEESVKPPAPISRSMSMRVPQTPGAPKLRRRANSVRLKFVQLGKDAF